MTITVKQLSVAFENINNNAKSGSKKCPYCEQGLCMFACDDNHCNGTEAEQSECAYRS